jgi:hypothetical protein
MNGVATWLLIPCVGLVLLWPGLLRTIARIIVAYAAGLAKEGE